MLIDFHTHCFPDKLAPHAVGLLKDAAGGIKAYNEATVSSLKETMKNEKVNICVVLNIATNEKQQKNVNDFAAEINKEKEFEAFGSVWPDEKCALDELERIKSMGMKGIKFHPEYQNFFVDDEKMKPIYKKISQLGLITVFHAGEDFGYAAPYHCTPKRLCNALKWFDSPVVAAHWGGLNMSEEVIKYLCGRDLYFDISFGYSHIPRPAAEKILEKHGTDKILFGTDSPWQKAEHEMRLLSALELSDDDYNNIKYKNAVKLLNL